MSQREPTPASIIPLTNPENLAAQQVMLDPVLMIHVRIPCLSSPDASSHHTDMHIAELLVSCYEVNEMRNSATRVSYHQNYTEHIYNRFESKADLGRRRLQ